MQLTHPSIVDRISPEVFREEFYVRKKPVILKNFVQDWPALDQWNWDYFIQRVGPKKVGVYNNIRSDSRTPVNTADDYIRFDDYIHLVKKGPVELRIFLFNLLEHAPELIQDIQWPDAYLPGLLKKFPMLFIGGAGSVTHMHFDMDLSHILHTQFGGKKRVLLFPYEEKNKLYRRPFEVLSSADFSGYYKQSGNPDYSRYPAIQLASGYDFILEPGDTLFMPAGYWHHMEYLESGFALSLRCLQTELSGKIQGVWNLFGMRSLDTLFKKTIPDTWYHWKMKKIQEMANLELLKERGLNRSFQG